MKTIVVLAILATAVTAFPHFNLKGKSKHHGKILGGEEADLGQFPYQASIQLDIPLLGWSHLCGGVVLNENMILATATCTIGRPDQFFTDRVQVGFLTLDDGDFEQTSQVRPISEIILHPDFAYNVLTGQYRNDIAIFVLETPLDLTGEYVQPISLPPAHATPDMSNASCIASGWGTEAFGITEAPSNELLFIDLATFDDDYCEALYNSGLFDLYVASEMMCAGLQEGGGGTCTGDRGGPLTCTALDGNDYLFGLTSFFDNTCGEEAGHPEVFTQVTAYLDWIDSVVASKKH